MARPWKPARIDLGPEGARVLGFLTLQLSVYALVVTLAAAAFALQVPLVHRVEERYWVAFFFGLGVPEALLLLPMMAFYVLHALKDPRWTPRARAAWVTVLVLGPLFAMPLYWILRFNPWGSQDGGVR